MRNIYFFGFFSSQKSYFWNNLCRGKKENPIQSLSQLISATTTPGMCRLRPGGRGHWFRLVPCWVRASSCPAEDSWLSPPRCPGFLWFASCCRRRRGPVDRTPAGSLSGHSPVWERNVNVTNLSGTVCSSCGCGQDPNPDQSSLRQLFG